MANACFYEMHIRGSHDSCKEFLEILQGKNPEKILRVSAADLIAESGTEESYNMDVDGICAWSVRSSMTTEGRRATGLKEESERLGLEIEVYSEEPGFAFMEHFHYRNGEELCKEEADAIWYYFDTSVYDSFKEFLEDHDLSPEQYSMEDLDSNNDLRVGGYEYNFLFAVA